MRREILRVLMCLSLTTSIGFGAEKETPSRVHHELDLTLLPKENRLIATDSITIKTDGMSALSFLLAEKASIKSLEVNGREEAFDFVKGVITLPLEGQADTGDVSVMMAYTAIFNDPISHLPANTEDPGHGIIGTISEEGTFLLPEAGWYPHIPNSLATYRIRVEAPGDVIAVTAGRSLGHLNRGVKTISSWEVRHPVEGIALSAGRYVVAERTVAGIQVATYFLAQSSHLSDRYLTAVADYIALYTDLFGPYPFEKFAVVENFFATGYGFPSYTLLGSSVIRLPFIIRTSLGHEVAHCWWGNGVWVDESMGNWSEALTTYVADYLYKERTSAEDALQYRRQILRDYATLVTPEEDFPLTAFRHRYNPASRAIGYGKGAMVFHMLRRLIGEEAFWEGLRLIYREKLFQPVSWSGFQSVFEQTGNQALHEFFDQWLSRKGAPLVSLTQVNVEACADSWRIRGLLSQEQPPYPLQLGLVLETHAGSIEKSLRLTGKEEAFEIISHSPPKRLSVDPGCDVFRRLYPSEIPPMINSVKGSEALVVLIADDSSPELLAATRTLLRSLDLKNYRLTTEGKIPEGELTDKDILIVGCPEHRDLLSTLPATLSIGESGFRIDSEFYNRPEDTFFGVFTHPYRRDRVVAVFLPLSPKGALAVARKITHYGKYSFLAFRQGRNLQKGIWPITESPLIYTWNPE